VDLEQGFTRTVAMHLPTGRALVTIDDPYREHEPHGLAEVVLAPGSGDAVTGHDAAPRWYAARADRDAELAARRTEIGSLDGGQGMVSDEERTFPVGDDRARVDHR